MDIDFESMFKGPAQADKRPLKKVAPTDEFVDSTKEPKRSKIIAHTRISSSQPIIDIDKFLEAGNE
uniref:Uncharacterized protein n=1 Tax=Cannabis sativa TaxID=3483 RepID=A0A803QS96_CANSA